MTAVFTDPKILPMEACLGKVKQSANTCNWNQNLDVLVNNELTS